MRVLAKSAQRGLFVRVSRGKRGSWRWQVVAPKDDGSGTRSACLPSVRNSHATPQGAVDDWLETARALGADPRIPIETGPELG